MSAWLLSIYSRDRIVTEAEVAARGIACPVTVTTAGSARMVEIGPEGGKVWLNAIAGTHAKSPEIVNGPRITFAW